jgi:hypothetical protein
VAGIQYAAGAGLPSRFDRGAVVAQRGLTSGAARHDKDLRGALEGMAQARGVLVVSLAHPDTTLSEQAGLFRVANADAKLRGRHFLEEPLRDGFAKISGGSGDNDHKFSLLPGAATRVRRPRYQ